MDWESFAFPQHQATTDENNEQDRNEKDNNEKIKNEKDINEDDKKDKNEKDILIEAFENIRNEDKLEKKHKKIISKFADLFITCSLKDPMTRKKLLKKFRYTVKLAGSIVQSADFSFQDSRLL